MAEPADRVTVALDAAIVAETRAAIGGASTSDAAVVEDALNRFLLGRLARQVQGRSDLTEEEALELAMSEQRAARRERDAA